MELFKDRQVAFAISAVREAALLADRVQQDLVSAALTKGDRSPVTVADFTAQAVIARRLQIAFPDEQLIGEESSSDLRAPDGAKTSQQVTAFVKSVLEETSEEQAWDWIDRGSGQPGKRFWTLDPVDGTKGFLRKQQYAVALALVEDGLVQIGALGCPHIRNGNQVAIGGAGSLVLAIRGAGSWVSPLRETGEWKPLQVSQQTDRTRARLLRSAEAAHTDLSAMDAIAQHLGIGSDPVRMDSQAKYSLLAAGQGELLFRLISPKMPDYKEKIWDQAAGTLVVQEAGGRVTDLDGRKLDFTQGRTLKNNRGVLASNGLLHDAALEAIKAVDA